LLFFSALKGRYINSVGQRPTLAVVFFYRKGRKKQPPCPLQRGNCKGRNLFSYEITKIKHIKVRTKKREIYFRGLYHI